MPNEVWTLGAGFSRSLGGPLLGDLLIESVVRDQVLRLLPDEESFLLSRGDGGLAACDAFETYMKFAERGNAETFLDRLREAVEHRDPAYFLVQKDTDQGAILIAAKRTIALQAFAITKRCDLTSERWMPYVHWAACTEGATVITFNYDDVVERAFNGKMQVVLPQTTPGDDGNQILHLHGCATWSEETSASVAGMNSVPEHPVIASPGDKMAVSDGVLSPLWALAEKRIVEADKIHVVGFSFSAHDSNAWRRIVRAIRRNDKFARHSHHRTVDIVIGPGSEDHIASMFERHAPGVSINISHETAEVYLPIPE